MSRRVFFGALVVMAALGLLGLGITLSSSYGASQVAANARSLHWANASQGAAGIARAAVAQAVFFGLVENTDEAARGIAMSEARTTLAAAAVFQESDEALPEAEPDFTEFISLGQQTVDLLQQGNPQDAETLRIGSFEPAFEELRISLSSAQQALAGEIAESERSGGTITRLTFVAITFAIPATVMVVFWAVLRRRVRVRDEEMRARIEAERELNRAKDEFIAGLSHELRTPLTTIYGFSELLSEEESIPGPAREMLSLINSSATDLTRMVNDLLAAARIEANALTVSAETNDLAEQVALAVAPYRKAGERVDVNVEDVPVFADPLHLRQIINNLISNALRHGGERVKVAGRADGDHVELLVMDDGPGVASELEGALFQRFAHGGRKALVAGSVGLGLAISQELAIRQGGGIDYRRTSDGWTVFVVTLPRASETGTEQPLASAEAAT